MSFHVDYCRHSYAAVRRVCSQSTSSVQMLGFIFKQKKKYIKMTKCVFSKNVNLVFSWLFEKKYHCFRPIDNNHVTLLIYEKYVQFFFFFNNNYTRLNNDACTSNTFWIHIYLFIFLKTLFMSNVFFHTLYINKSKTSRNRKNLISLEFRSI